MRECESEINELSGAVIGCAMTVHRRLGPGYLEAIYESALAVEFALNGIPFERQVHFQVHYRGRPVGEGVADFVVDGRLVVELKAVEGIRNVHQAQVISYLRGMGMRWGLLIKFNEAMLKSGVRRVVWEQASEEAA